MEEDQIQLCLRLFSLLREYTVFAHKQHQKNTDLETAIESEFFHFGIFFISDHCYFRPVLLL